MRIFLLVFGGQKLSLSTFHFNHLNLYQKLLFKLKITLCLYSQFSHFACGNLSLWKRFFARETFPVCRTFGYLDSGRGRTAKYHWSSAGGDRKSDHRCGIYRFKIRWETKRSQLSFGGEPQFELVSSDDMRRGQANQAGKQGLLHIERRCGKTRLHCRMLEVIILLLYS